MARRYEDPARELAGDWKVMLVVLSGLLVQSAHPVIGAGVGEHSAYARDPFGRLVRSLFPVLALVLMDDEDAAALGRDLRAMHKAIGGTDHRGRSYHAWDPEAAFLVLATAIEGSSEMARLYSTPLTESERNEVFRAWRRAGEHFGIPDRAMPADLAAYDEWWADLLANRLEDHPTARDVLTTIARPPVAPPLVPEWTWLMISPVFGHVAILVTLAATPPELRERLGLRWTRREQMEFAAVAASVRATDRLLPARVRGIVGTVVKRRWGNIQAYAAHGAELGDSPALVAEGVARPVLAPGA